jgi:hypothetical protein
MAFYRCGSGGVSTILTNGQVSTTSDYKTANFNDISDFTHIFLKIYYTTSEEIDVFFDIPIKLIPVNGYYDFRVYEPTVDHIDCRITRTSIQVIWYSGDWRNIYCDIKGIKDNTWG